MGELHDIEKQALNTPIQGGAAGVINRAMVKIEKRIEKENWDAKVILQIHDQLIYEVDESQAEGFVKLMIEEMERKIPFYDEEVSFPVDVEIGYSWGTLKKWQEWDFTQRRTS